MTESEIVKYLEIKRADDLSMGQSSFRTTPAGAARKAVVYLRDWHPEIATRQAHTFIVQAGHSWQHMKEAGATIDAERKASAATAQRRREAQAAHMRAIREQAQ
ncbi:MAG: hypothetical protein GY847_29025 [Proteobacteria bacterium]|nr:hypothetical protein [Pseudomonadota bacterium]